MKSNIVITNSEEFRSIIVAIEESYNKIRDIFDKEKTNKEEINETDTWSGNASKAMYEKYRQLSENFEPIKYSMAVYIKFLKKTLEDYERLEQEMSRNIDIVANELDVNS